MLSLSVRERRPNLMRVAVCLLAIAALQRPAAAQEPPPLNLPVSLERIREELARPPRPSLLDTIDARPHFRVTVEEQRPSFVEMFDPQDFDGGPVPPGGLYAYEQQQRLFPQSTPIVGFDVLPFFRELAASIRSARRARSEAAAREEVARAMAEFCAAQPNNGAGVVGCGEVR